ncbi:alpha/beta hydrolase [Naasia sp.]|uniref:alpha/beta hydrolase n=1 Tax=Naasia sp. TaxID=2546198 RepID=UPI00260F2349|nr:alpha/beta hydrolase [Naasia sp.]
MPLSPRRPPGRALAPGLTLPLAVVLAGCVAAGPAASPSASAPGPPWSPSPSAGAGRSPSVGEVVPDVVYGRAEGSDLMLDAYLPASARAEAVPAVIVLHGGSFVSGDKGGLDAAPIAQLLAQEGYAAFSVDYRLLPGHPYPDALQDVQTAIRWLRQSEQVERFGIDPARIGGFGGSAGAILISEAGTAGEGPLDGGARLAAVVELSGAMDLTPAALTADLPQEEREVGLAYLGCSDPLDCPAAEAASPLSAVDPSDPPFFLAHSADEAIPEQPTLAMADALRAAGVPAKLTIRPGSAHSVLMLDAGLVQDILAFYAAFL